MHSMIRKFPEPKFHRVTKRHQQGKYFLFLIQHSIRLFSFFFSMLLCSNFSFLHTYTSLSVHSLLLKDKKWKTSMTNIYSDVLPNVIYTGDSRENILSYNLFTVEQTKWKISTQVIPCSVMWRKVYRLCEWVERINVIASSHGLIAIQCALKFAILIPLFSSSRENVVRCVISVDLLLSQW